jgi:hypothetical protein
MPPGARAHLRTTPHALAPRASRLAQVVSLNVAVNSHNNVMLTLLVSNNFVELKSNVFKRFEPENLFVLSCSDMVERFQLTAYLLIVSLHVLSVQADSRVLSNVLGAVMMVSMAELLVDWIKHAFVIKFNGMQPAVYRRFHAVLCRDLANSVAGGHDDRQAGPHMLQSGAAASTRIGFSCMPLLCLVVRSIWQFVRWLELMRTWSGILILLLSWAFLFVVKTLLSVALTGYACEQALQTAAARERPPGLHEDRSGGSEWQSDSHESASQQQRKRATSTHYGPMHTSAMGNRACGAGGAGTGASGACPSLALPHGAAPPFNGLQGAEASASSQPLQTSGGDLAAGVRAGFSGSASPPCTPMTPASAQSPHDATIGERVDTLARADSLIRRNVGQFSSAMLESARRPLRGAIPSLGSSAEL